MSFPPLHDIVIRHIAEYLVGQNNTLVNLIRLSKRFYALRDIFREKMMLNRKQSGYAIDIGLYTWYHLRFHSSDRLIDDHMLKNFTRLRSLELEFCQYITDLSPLSSLRQLSMYSCYNIRDVSALRSIDTLTLSGLEVTDFSPLCEVQNLTLQWCNQLIDVSSLSGVQNLSLILCHGVSDVSPLYQVPNLSLGNCRNIHDVRALGSVKRLQLSALSLLHVPETVEILKCMPNLTIYGCKDIIRSDASGLWTPVKI